jgi:crotonobetainyl-CoA:carnitine CoA-transferase CaiB-like acyl-CoA transferase
MPTGPLAGIRIIDLSLVLLGPTAAKMLGDLGADVIKVEGVTGDNRRNTGPSRNKGMGTQYMLPNHSKRSLAINMKDPRGKAAFLRLAATADALIHNTRPKSMARLGLDYESVRKANPGIIYCAAVGFGRGGRYAGKPAYDDIIQGLTALPSLIARSAPSPQFVPINIADRVTGVMLANSLLAALVHRLRTGEGQEIEVPMFETMADFVLSEHLWDRMFEPPLKWGSSIRLFDRRPYATQDGHICAMPATDAHWASFCDIIGRPELKIDARFASRADRSRRVREVYDLVESALRTRPSAFWLDALERADIPCAPLHSLESLPDDPHLGDVGFFKLEEHPSEGRLRVIGSAVRYSRTPPANPRHAPRIGEHSAEVLREAGLSADEIEALIRDGIVNDMKIPRSA